VDDEAVAGGQQLADPAAVAGAGVGLVAQQAAWRAAGQFSGLLERQPGLQGRQAFVHDLLEPLPLPPLVRLAPLCRGAKGAEVNVADPGPGEARRKLAL